VTDAPEGAAVHPACGFAQAMASENDTAKRVVSKMQALTVAFGTATLDKARDERGRHHRKGRC